MVVNGELVSDFTVKSAEPDVMSAEKTEKGRICLTKLKPFGDRMVDFTVTYRDADYIFRCNDDSWKTDGENPDGLGLVNLSVACRGNEILPGESFGFIAGGGDDNISVIVDRQQVTDFEVESGRPDTMSAEKTVDGSILLTQIKSFGGERIDFTVSYKGSFYTFYCEDGTQPINGGEPEEQLDVHYPDEYAEFTRRQYTDEEIQALVDAQLSFEDACDKLSTLSDAVQYLYMRGYRFQSESLGTDAEYRYYANSGACVGGSGLLNALLEGDYDGQGYVYIFYARTEHVLDYFVLDGVYFYCDLVTVFNNGNTDITKNPVCYMTKNPETFCDKWHELEPHDLNDSESDMYLATIFTTAYCGNPAKSKVMLKDSESGKYSNIPLSPEEKESQQILFLRDGYTFEF